MIQTNLLDLIKKQYDGKTSFLLYNTTSGRLLAGLDIRPRWIGGRYARVPSFVFTIHGRARDFYFAYRSGSRSWVNRFRGGFSPWNGGKRYSIFTRLTNIEVCLTGNANRVPWA